MATKKQILEWLLKPKSYERDLFLRQQTNIFIERSSVNRRLFDSTCFERKHKKISRVVAVERRGV